MRLFEKDRAFYRMLATIAAPIALQNLITVMVAMMDTLMIGQLGEVQLSATSIANQLWFMMNVLGFGIAGGANVLIAQYWGKQEIPIIRRVEALTLKVGLAAALCFSVVALVFPRQFMSIFTLDQEVISYGCQYLRIIGYSYPIYTLVSISIIMLRSVGTVNISVAVYLVSLVVNTSLNYILIFGKLGAPRLGVQGGAIATCCARVAEALVLLYYLVFREKKIRFHWRDLLSNNAMLYRKYVTLSLPIIGNELIWSTGNAMVSVVIGRMGTSFTAANSIYTVLNQLVTVVIFGVGNAALTIVGNTIGAGHYDLAKERSKRLLWISIWLGLAACAITLVASPLMISMYNLTAETIQIAHSISRVGALLTIFQSLAVIDMVGVLRAGGDGNFVLLVETVFLWLEALPLGFLAGLKWGWSAPMVFFLLRSDEIFKTLVSTWRICGFKWLRDITVRD
ncbi:MAG: MATE family efflux transporter [Anaerotruncus sp.]|nr:MATE family efflux transporter [Anaerotruncus sp.]